MPAFACTKTDGDKVREGVDTRFGLKSFVVRFYARLQKKVKMAKFISKTVGLTKNLLQQAKPKLYTIQAYAKVELVPPSPSELPAVKRGIENLIQSAKTGRYKELTVREAWLNTLVAIEVYCWFFVGECIGKRHIIGYDV